MAPLVPIAGVSLCQWLLGCFSSRFPFPRIAGQLRTMVLSVSECFVHLGDGINRYPVLMTKLGSISPCSMRSRNACI